MSRHGTNHSTLLAALAVGGSLLLSGLAHTAPAHAEDNLVKDATVRTANDMSSASRFIVTYEDKATAPQASRFDDLIERYDRKLYGQRKLASGASVVRLDKPIEQAKVGDFMKQLQAQEGVAKVEVDRIMTVTSTPSDPHTGKQWHYTDEDTSIRLPGALDIATGKGVTVGVVDSGITSHPDLSPLRGYDFTSDAGIARDGDGRDSNPADEGDWSEATDTTCNDTGKFISSSWHGTHTLGTIAAKTNNGSGVAGVAGDSKAFMARALGHCGGYTSDIIDAMLWSGGEQVQGVPANPNPASVVSMSLGGSGSCDTSFQTAIDKLVSKGVTVVVAAGNEGQDARNVSPANCRNVITVGSSGPDGKLAYYSNYGPRIDITAPGGNLRLSEESGVLSTVNTGERRPSGSGYGWMQGTSMATPHVAGIIALMKSANPSLTPDQIKQTLQETSRPLPGGCTLGCGSGLVDATAAVKAVAGDSPVPAPTEEPTASPTPEPTSTPTGEPTPTPVDDEQPTPAPVDGVVADAGFESAAGWNDPQGIITTSEKAEKHSGQGVAWLGGQGKTGDRTISQQFTLPADATTLDYWLKVSGHEVPFLTFDRLSVRIDGQEVASASNRNSRGAWEQHSADIRQWAGKTVTLEMTSNEDFALKTNFFVDDVTVK